MLMPMLAPLGVDRTASQIKRKNANMHSIRCDMQIKVSGGFVTVTFIFGYLTLQ